jgi:uncharacterized paraquat-inducible protein A
MTDAETLPWCEECEAFAAPTEDGNCGQCGQKVVFRREAQ